MRPASITEAVARLSTCLALVKPVGMSEGDTSAWLTVAAGEVAHLPVDILAGGCSVARKTCTHHAQIIPTILKECGNWWELRRSMHPQPIPESHQLAAPDPWQPTQTELDELKAIVGKALRA